MDRRCKTIWIGRRYADYYQGNRRGDPFARPYKGKRWGECRVAYRLLPRIHRSEHYLLKSKRCRRTGQPYHEPMYAHW